MTKCRWQGFSKTLLSLRPKLKKNTKKDIKIHCIPDDWTDPAPSVDKNQPPFGEIDNPGEWSSFSFRPVFKVVSYDQFLHT